MRHRIAREEQGTIEVRIDNGFVDVLTSIKLIEVKHYKKWKQAMGQVIAYSYNYEQKERWIYLFGEPNMNEKEIIDKITIRNNIRVKYLDPLQN